MRTGWMLVALLALGSNSAAAELTVFVTAEGSASPYMAERIAGSIFRKAGVAIVWRGPKPPVTGVPPTWLRVDLMENTPEDRLPGALATSHPFGGCELAITVFFDRVRQRTRGFERQSALLAYVLAHEITHVIQRIDRHSDSGVMKAHWSADDFLAIFDARLGFAPEDALMIQRALAEGWCRDTEPLIGRSESGSVFRPQ